MADVEFTKDGHVAHVRLNRPKSLDAINPALFAASPLATGSEQIAAYAVSEDQAGGRRTFAEKHPPRRTGR